MLYKRYGCITEEQLDGLNLAPAENDTRKRVNQKQTRFKRFTVLDHSEIKKLMDEEWRIKQNKALEKKQKAAKKELTAAALAVYRSEEDIPAEGRFGKAPDVTRLSTEHRTAYKYNPNKHGPNSKCSNCQGNLRFFVFFDLGRSRTGKVHPLESVGA